MKELIEIKDSALYKNTKLEEIQNTLDKADGSRLTRNNKIAIQLDKDNNNITIVNSENNDGSYTERDIRGLIYLFSNEDESSETKHLYAKAIVEKIEIKVEDKNGKLVDFSKDARKHIAERVTEHTLRVIK